MNSPLSHKIALSLFPGIGSINARKLLAYAGSLNAVFESTKKDLKDIPGFGPKLLSIIFEHRQEVLEKAHMEIEFIEKYKLKTFFYLDPNYPKRLAQCDDAPVIMYMKGDVDLNTSKVISVVGTRNATEKGREYTHELIHGLKDQGLRPLVVSGLAYGIDVCAHKEAMKARLPTIGVVGHGLDTMYPAAHASIAKDMINSKGALLSDFSSKSAIDPGNFIRRNRIVAGLADCTIVIESANRGGALVTADIANSYNRDVFAYPGRPSDQYSAGCNKLIKGNKAALIENSSDLIAYMGWEASKQITQTQLLIDLSADEETISKVLAEKEIATTDLISRATNFSVQKINSILLDLEFKGIVKSLPGSRFKLLMQANNV